MIIQHLIAHIKKKQSLLSSEMYRKRQIPDKVMNLSD